MNGLNEVNVGVSTGLSAPIDIGIPFAVVFLIKNGMGLFFLSKPPSTSLGLLSVSGSADLSISNRSVTTTFGARDFVVIVLKQKMLLIKFSHIHISNSHQSNSGPICRP